MVGGCLVGGFPVCCELELFVLSAFPVPEVVADFTDLWVEVASSDFVALSYLLELLLYELVYSPSCWGFPAGVSKSVQW